MKAEFSAKPCIYIYISKVIGEMPDIFVNGILGDPVDISVKIFGSPLQIYFSWMFRRRANRRHACAK